jgi:hypothetical protein
MPTQISDTSKVVYMYDQQTDKWYAISGVANEGHEYNWTAPHTFGSAVTVNDVITVDGVITAKDGVNIFQNPTARDAAIPSPVTGTVCFVQQTNGGTDINQVQIYTYNSETLTSSWVGMLDAATLRTKNADYNLGLADAGQTLLINSTSDVTITVPLNSAVPFAIGQRIDVVRLNTGNVTFAGATVGVTINSKNSNKKIAARYSGATLIKYDTDTWVLIGDLTA